LIANKSVNIKVY